MVKPFLVIAAFLIVLVGMVSAHYMSYHHNAAHTMLQRISSVTHISSPSLSAAYYEPRLLFGESMLNPAYPQMPTMNKMDFVYAQ